MVQELKHNLFCYKCGTTEDLMKASHSRTTQHYVCNAENTLRIKEYRKTIQGKERTSAAIKASEKRYPGKQEARIALNCAVKRGDVIKPKLCALCHQEKKPLDGHHFNPTRNQLFVKFFCRKCHRLFHSNNCETY